MSKLSWHIKVWFWRWLGISQYMEEQHKRMKEAADANLDRTQKMLAEHLSITLNANESQMRDQFASYALSSGASPLEAYDIAERMLDERDIRMRKKPA